VTVELLAVQVLDLDDHRVIAGRRVRSKISGMLSPAISAAVKPYL
jgi:hypothetical protein